MKSEVASMIYFKNGIKERVVRCRGMFIFIEVLTPLDFLLNFLLAL